MFCTFESVILVELLGLENLTSAFGLLLLFQGVAVMIGTPIAGAIYEFFGNYDISFYIGGILLVSSSFLSFTAQILHQIKKKKIEHEDVITPTQM